MHTYVKVSYEAHFNTFEDAIKWFETSAKEFDASWTLVSRGLSHYEEEGYVDAHICYEQKR